MSDLIFNISMILEDSLFVFMLKFLLELMFKLLQFLEAIEIPFKREGLLDLSVRSSTLKLTSLNSKPICF